MPLRPVKLANADQQIAGERQISLPLGLVDPISRPLREHRQPPALKGPWYQTAGGVWVVNSRDDYMRLVDILWETDLAGLDTETEGCDPRVESPIGKARIKVGSVSWIDPSLGVHPNTGRPLANRVMFANYGKAEEEGWLYTLKPWLESEAHGKVGHNIFSFDLHVFANHGIELRGIRGDTLRMSREWDVARMDHDLKSWLSGDPFNYDLWGSFTKVFIKPAPLATGLCTICGKNRRVADGCKKCGIEPYGITPNESEKQTVLLTWDEILSSPYWMAILEDYSTMDSKGCLELFPELVQRLQKMKWVGDKNMWDYYQEYKNAYMYVITGMEQAGQDIDDEYCREQSARAARDIEQLERKLVEWVGVDMNFGSPQQLYHLLYATGPKQAINKAKKNTGIIIGRGFPLAPWCKKWNGEEEDTCKEDALNWLMGNVRASRDKEGIKTLIAWKRATGIRSKYLDKLPRFMDQHGRIHACVGPDTETSRLAAKNPPIQQIPTGPPKDPYHTREAFTVGPDEALIGGDWSQLEPHISAHYLIVLFDDYTVANDLASGDSYLATAIRTWPWQFPEGTTLDDVKQLKKEIKGGTELGKKLEPVRKLAKILVLSLAYGKTDYGLGNDLRDEDNNPIGREAAGKYLDEYFKATPGMRRLQKWFINYSYKHGYARSLLGEYRRIPELRYENRASRGHGERVAMNTPIQKTAANIAMKAQLKCNTLKIPRLMDLGYYDDELARMEVRNIAQIHDELHFRCPWDNRNDAAVRIKHHMETAMELKVPLPVDLKIGKTWREVK